MAAITREAPQQFRVRFGELRGTAFTRFLRRDVVQIDPYLVTRAIEEVMRACTVRAANGRRLLWNEYRMILAHADFDLLGPLRASLDRDLATALGDQAKQQDADVVGELRITLVPDEANELAAGEAVVRTAFVPTERLPAPVPGEHTIHVGGWRPGGAEGTVVVDESAAAPSFVVRWAGGQRGVPSGSFLLLGRPHAGAPARFLGLEGASVRINKQQVLLSTGHSTVRIGRLPNTNPVHVNGHLIAPGAEVEVAPPVRVSLSNDELVIEVSKA